MGDLLTTGSILAAFFAGGVALFAPCCIVFLAPSYMAVAVKNRRWRLLPLTFLFAAGLALVLVPITLGMSLVASGDRELPRPALLPRRGPDAGARSTQSVRSDDDPSRVPAGAGHPVR